MKSREQIVSEADPVLCPVHPRIRYARQHLPGDVAININLQNEILWVIAPMKVSR